MRLAADEVDDAIDEAMAWFEARQAPSAFFWFGPGSEPEDLREHLEAKGLEAWDRDAPCMAGNLDELDWEGLERTPAGFRIERVGTNDELDTFARTIVRAFELPESAAQAWVDATREFGIGEAPWSLYVGFLHGQPVATNLLVPGAGVAGALGIGTVRSARRRGIGAAITLAGFRDARELGYRYGVLFSRRWASPYTGESAFARRATASAATCGARPEPANAGRRPRPVC